MLLRNIFGYRFIFITLYWCTAVVQTESNHRRGLTLQLSSAAPVMSVCLCLCAFKNNTGRVPIVLSVFLTFK